MMHNWEAKKDGPCSFYMLDECSAKQMRSKSKDCPYFPELDLVDPFVVDAVHLRQINLPNEILAFVFVPFTV